MIERKEERKKNKYKHVNLMYRKKGEISRNEKKENKKRNDKKNEGQTKQ